MSLTVSRAEELLAAFGNMRVVVVGDAFVDTYIEGEIERLNPESHHVHLLRVGKGTEKQRSGGAGNAARNIVSLGARATLLSVCGNDALGRKLPAIASREGYDARMVTDPQRSTINKCRFVTKDGVLLRVDFEDGLSIRPIEDALVPQFVARLEGILPNADALLVSDYGKGLLTMALCNRVLDHAIHGVPILADVKPAQVGHFTGVNMMAPNLKEAAAAIGTPDETDPEVIAPKLAKRYNTEVFLTAGESGIYVADKNGAQCAAKQEHQVKVGDTSGCGDTAAAAILLSKLCGATSIEAAEFANAAAAVTVSMVGAYAPKPQEVLRMLAS